MLKIQQKVFGSKFFKKEGVALGILFYFSARKLFM